MIQTLKTIEQLYVRNSRSWSRKSGRISDNTQWNGTQLLDGSTYSSPAQFQIGSNANQTIDVALANLSHTSDSSVFGVDLSSIATETFSSSARYVMVQQNGVEQDIWISEIDIMSGGVDVANSATNSNVAITMHSHNVVIWDGWGGGGMLLDDVVGGHPANGWCTYSPESDRWFEIDLGASYAIDSIKIHSIREGTEGPELANNLTAFISANSMRDSNGNAIAHADLVVGANDAYKVGTTSAVSSSNPFETLHTQQPATSPLPLPLPTLTPIAQPSVPARIAWSMRPTT